MQLQEFVMDAHFDPSLTTELQSTYFHECRDQVQTEWMTLKQRGLVMG